MSKLYFLSKKNTRINSKPKKKEKKIEKREERKKKRISKKEQKKREEKKRARSTKPNACSACTTRPYRRVLWGLTRCGTRIRPFSHSFFYCALISIIIIFFLAILPLFLSFFTLKYTIFLPGHNFFLNSYSPPKKNAKRRKTALK